MMQYDPFAIFIKHQYAVKRAEMFSNSTTPLLVLDALSKDWTELPEGKKRAYQRLAGSDDAEKFEKETKDILTEGFFI